MSKQKSENAKMYFENRKWKVVLRWKVTMVSDILYLFLYFTLNWATLLFESWFASRERHATLSFKSRFTSREACDPFIWVTVLHHERDALLPQRLDFRCGVSYQMSVLQYPWKDMRVKICPRVGLRNCFYVKLSYKNVTWEATWGKNCSWVSYSATIMSIYHSFK